MLRYVLYSLFFTYVLGSCPAQQIVTIWDLPDVTVTKTTTATTTICTSCSNSPTTTLQPGVHWNQDTSNPQVLIPNSQIPQYYAPQTAGPSTGHPFQWVNTTLTLPAVPLDQSSLLTYTWSGVSNTLTVTFNSAVAQKVAQSWAASNLFVVFTPGCGNYAGGDNCYIRASSITFSSNACIIIGTVLQYHDVLDSFAGSWGIHIPAISSSTASGLDLHGMVSSAINKHLPKTTGGGWQNWQKALTTRSTSNGARSQWSSLGSSATQSESSMRSVDPGIITTGSGSSSISTKSSMTLSNPSQTGPTLSTTISGTSLATSSGNVLTGSSKSSTVTSSTSSDNTSLGLASSTTERFSGSISSLSSTGGSTTSGSSTGSTSTSLYTSLTKSSSDTGSGSSLTTTSRSVVTSTSYTSTSHSTITSPPTTSATFSSISSSISSISKAAVEVNEGNCGKVLDTHGLPTACIGPDFDFDLDSIDGFLTLDEASFSSLASLYPAVFAASKTKRSLYRRCDPTDSNCQISSIASSASIIVSSALASAASAGQSGSLPSTAVASAATAVASGIAQVAASNGQPLSAQQQQAIVDDVKAGIDISVGSVTISTSFDKTLPSSKENVNLELPSSLNKASPWGNQPLLHTFENKDVTVTNKNSSSHTSSTDEAISIYCVDCGLTGSMTFSGEVAGSITDGITKFSVDIDADVALSIGLGFDAKIDLLESWTDTIFVQGIPDLCAGSVLCLGPSVSVATTLSVEVDTVGYLLAGGTWTWSGASASLDAFGDSSSSGWTPTFSPSYDIGGSEDITVTVSLPVSVNIGITIADGKFQKQASLVLTPSIDAEATISADSQNGITTDHGKCDGVEVVIDYDVSLTYSVFGLKSGTLWTLGKQQLAGWCLALSGGGNAGLPTGPVSYSSGYSPVSLLDASDNTPLIICANGDVYKIDSSYIPDGTCSATWISYIQPNLPLAVQNVIAGYQNQVPIIFEAEIAAVGVSRFQVVSQSHIPAAGNYISFSSFNHYQPSDNSVNQYRLVQCKNLDASAAGMADGMYEVFVLETATASLAILESGSIGYSITNGAMYNCQFLDLKLSTAPVVA